MSLSLDELELTVRRALRDAWSLSDVHVRAATERALIDARIVTVDRLWKDRGLQRMLGEVVRDVRLEALERRVATLDARCRRLEEQLTIARRTIAEVAERLDFGTLVPVVHAPPRAA